jgi:hypothetical protein
MVTDSSNYRVFSNLTKITINSTVIAMVESPHAGGGKGPYCTRRAFVIIPFIGCASDAYLMRIR